MKKALALALCLLLTLGAGTSLATVTHTETGEEISYENGVLRVYDRVVFEQIGEKNDYRGVIIADAEVPLAALTKVMDDLLAQLESGEVETLRVLGMEQTIGVELTREIQKMPERDQISALLYLLGLAKAEEMPQSLKDFIASNAPLDIFDEATEQFTVEGGNNVGEIDPDELISRPSEQIVYGYLARGGSARVPFIRIPLEVRYAPRGDFSDLDVSQRTYEEDYTFGYAHHNQAPAKSWGLINVIRGVVDFFQSR